VESDVSDDLGGDFGVSLGVSISGEQSGGIGVIGPMETLTDGRGNRFSEFLE